MSNHTLYDLTVPVYVRYLSNLVRIIEKAKRHSEKGGKSENKLVKGKLAPDMYNLVQQVGYAYFMTLETVMNLGGLEGPKMGYDEKSFAELQKSLRTVVAFLKKCPQEKFKGSEKKTVSTFLHPKKKYPATQYVTELALPNFFFHVTTAYDILRHNGVPLKKDDYLGI